MRFLRPVLAAALTLVLLGLGVTIDGTALAVPPSPAEQPAVVSQECGPTGPEATDEAEPTLEQLIGQKLMVTMSGRKVSAALARRVRRGEVGGVILLSRNVATRPALGKLTRKLQRAAAQGGQPPLLIAIDQEGGSVRRVPWAPLTIPIPEIGRIGSSSLARAQGARTGNALRRLHV